MTIFWTTIEVLSTAFENYLVLETLGKMFVHKYSDVKKYFCFYFVLALSTGYVTLINYYNYFEGWLALVTILIFEIYSACFIRDKTYLKFVIPVVLFSLILGINILVTYVISMAIGMSNTFIYSSKDSTRLLALFLTKFSFWIVTRLIICVHKKTPLRLNKNQAIITIAMFFLTLIVSICLIKLQTNTDNTDELIFIAISCVLITNIFIFYMINKISKDNNNNLKISVLELQLSEQQNMIEEAGLISRDIKKTEHDLKHHLLGILGMIEEREIMEAEKYLKELLHEYETNIFKYISVENSAINSILNLKIGRCHENKIDIKVEIESNFLGFSDIDICVLLANLLDNAIEASHQNSIPQIIISIKSNKNYLCIEIRNRIDNSVLEKNSELKTTKINKSAHGFGMDSISQIVEKYDGMKNYYERNGFFIADIWLKRNPYSLK
ncbi:MAG: GHKL domain-containing protein [Erysipelotrichaceae bacterium]|nr:GHKL domain-containing protein [Erysipelotrichaceae bacterium]